MPGSKLNLVVGIFLLRALRIFGTFFMLGLDVRTLLPVWVKSCKKICVHYFTLNCLYPPLAKSSEVIYPTVTTATYHPAATVILRG